MENYIGHPNQVYGVEQMRLSGGKGDGMRMLYVRNGKGLEFWVSVDRCADISRLSLKGDNFAYFAPCGYVAPQYFDSKGLGFLKSFTAGFITTCGLTAVGSPCTDDGEELGLHGTVSNTPCENIAHWIAEDGIHIKAVVRDATLFAHKLLLEREYIVSLEKNEILLHDVVKNIGTTVAPHQILYHCNMGYPILSEKAEIKIPSVSVTPRDEHAKNGISTHIQVEEPQDGYQEMCFLHKIEGKAEISIYNPEINKGLKMNYNTDELPCFTQWKMMGKQEYVMGLEPGNCYPDGRAKARKDGTLVFLKPEETKEYYIKFTCFEK
ncbi:MAG: aldose 1-epimerase family protein [Clostridia bacterium]|nr:aldose 1-epimerase family protein [Clostridia bacterium]